jgi:hypothetical protein
MDFDWVRARAACSLPGVFGALRDRLQRDVAAANGLNRQGLRFSLNVSREDRIVVSRVRDLAGFSEGHHVVFFLSANEIQVREVDMVGKERPLFSAKPVLTPGGDCLLVVEGLSDMLELWQVSRKALDDLFFRFPDAR